MRRERWDRIGCATVDRTAPAHAARISDAVCCRRLQRRRAGREGPWRTRADHGTRVPSHASGVLRPCLATRLPWGGSPSASVIEGGPCDGHPLTVYKSTIVRYARQWDLSPIPSGRPWRMCANCYHRPIYEWRQGASQATCTTILPLPKPLLATARNSLWKKGFVVPSTWCEPNVACRLCNPWCCARLIAAPVWRGPSHPFSLSPFFGRREAGRIFLRKRMDVGVISTSSS